MRNARRIVAAFGAVAFAAIACVASAQPVPSTPSTAPPDSTTQPPPTPPLGTPSAPSGAGEQSGAGQRKRVTSTFTRTGEETDRFELGAGVVRGFFDAVGSFGYRRFVGEGPVFESSVMGELTGTTKDQLTEGVFSVYVLLRPMKTYRESWRLRPLVEAGPGVHVVLQGASLEGLNKTRFKSEVYLKTHLYVGFEALATRKWGFLVRGRGSIPSHRPLDYAQAAIFLR